MMNLFGETPVRKLLTLHALSGEKLVEATATPGNPCTFTTDVAKALKKLVIPFSDENGITGFTLDHAGKNLLDPTIVHLAPSSNSYISSAAYRGMIAKLPGAGEYTISRNIVSGNRFRVYASAEKPAVGVSQITLSDSSDSGLSKTVTVPEGYKYIYIFLSNNSHEITSNIQCETGTYASTYEAYDGHTYNFTWTDSATAGSLNALTGELTITQCTYRRIDHYFAGKQNGCA